MKVQTIHVGLGEIGREVLRRGCAAGLLEPVLLVDSSPDIAERFAGEFMAQVPMEVAEQPVVSRLEEAWAYVAASAARPAVAVVCTGSRVEEVAPVILEAVGCGLNVVSTCEELSFPWLKAAEIAEEIDRAAREAGVSVVGTGVNPGFVMDLLPALAARAVFDVTEVSAERVVDAGKRREGLRRKIGVGLSVEDFERLAAGGRLGHVGLGESACLVARALGVEWEGRVEERLVPVVADEAVESSLSAVRPGHVRGVQHEAVLAADGCVVRLRLRMAVGEREEYDRIEVRGEPPVSFTLKPGLHGDLVTAARVVNSVGAILSAPAGLLTVLDLAVVGRNEGWPT